MAKNHFKLILMLALVVLALLGMTGSAAHAAGVVNFTILHTNDMHGQLQQSGTSIDSSSNPGLARVSNVVNQVRTAKGAANVLVVDAGDEMQGSLLSNLGDGTATGKGKPMIAAMNQIGYNVATFGNHEFDWGQANLAARTAQATYPYVTANIVKKDGADCASSGWVKPDFATAPYVIQTVNGVKVAFIGLTTTETPTITVATATTGICFKDPTTSIEHYYAQMKADGAQVIVVLSHMGYTDGGYGYGIPVTGDQTIAKNLINDGMPVDLIIGGHSHTNLSVPTVVTVTGKTGQTTVGQAYYNGRNVGEADISVDTGTGAVTVAWKVIAWKTKATSATPPVNATGWKYWQASPAAWLDAFDTTADAAVDGVINTFANDPAYLAIVNQPIGYSAVDMPRNGGFADNMMGTFIDDAIMGQLNSDAKPENDIDIFFNNAGGIRVDWCYVSGAWQQTGCAAGTHAAGLLTYGNMFSVLPFGNATAVGTMTGAAIMDVVNQAPLTSNGVIQPAGLKFKYYLYKDGSAPFAWGAYDVQVYNRSTSAWEPLDLNKTYKVGTNEFLAPAGGDGYNGFKYMQSITYWGDMLDSVNAYVTAHYGTAATAYMGPNGDGTLDNRIIRDGTDVADSGSLKAITILHNDDSHGNLIGGSYATFTQLATLIKQERAHNPNRTILLNGGDQIQGDSMMYFFRTAPQGFTADGTPTTLTTHPMMAAMNLLGYDAMVLGNHEFNFGGTIFSTVMAQANFSVLGANVHDNGQYGLAAAHGGQGVQPYAVITRDGIKVAVVGITNHRVPNYELPSNIGGLTFDSDPIAVATTTVNTVKANENPNVVIALTHIGFTTNPKSVEVDNNVDTNLVKAVSGIDAILGAHSHTNPASPEAPYKYLPGVFAGVGGAEVVIANDYRYNTTLGEVVIGVNKNTNQVVTRAGRYLSVVTSGGSKTAEDSATVTLLGNYQTAINAYNGKVVGQTTVPIDTLKAFTQETNGANLQADASMYELNKHLIYPDFHLSGAMTNKLMADGATPANPKTLTIADMFAGMPYENSLVTINMNGPQLKAVLERAYRNYYYYKYVSGFGGYSYYTTCMIDTNAGNEIKYNDAYPTLPNGNNVLSLKIGDMYVNFSDANKYYKVSTVNYLAAGSCNFNNSGVSLWPLNQIADDTQYYVRDATIDYINFKGIVSPQIEGRLKFDLLPPTATVAVQSGPSYQSGGKTYVTSSTVLRVQVTDDVAGVGTCTIDVTGPSGTTHPTCVGGNNDLTLTGPDGSYSFVVNMTDVLGKVGTPVNASFELDNSMPTLTVNNPASQSYLHHEIIAIDVQATNGGAGMGTIVTTIDGKTVPNGGTVDLYTLALGDHTFLATATDNVGKTSQVQFQFTVTQTLTGLQAAVTRFRDSQDIKSTSLYTHLIKRLKLAQTALDNHQISRARSHLTMFRNTVKNANLKAITRFAKASLIADANFLISGLK